MVSEGVWMMFGLCMRVSGKALILNLLAKNILGHDTQILLFFQCPVLHKNACVLGCLDCVCGCLDHI